MSDVPTTGSPEIDKVVREEFVECIDITRQILGDRLGEIVSSDVLDKLSAVIPTELWRPMAKIILIGIGRISALDEEEFSGKAQEGG